jgi:iron complex outermembrane recepter protein
MKISLLLAFGQFSAFKLFSGENMQYISRTLFLFALAIASCSLAFSQGNGKISGKVIFGENSHPLGGVSVRVVPGNWTASTDSDGKYDLSGIPAGRYTVIAHVSGFEDVGRTVVLVSGGNGNVDITMRLSGVKEQVTVTATGDKQSSFDAIQPALTVGSTKILERGYVGIGDALNNEPGVHERTATPVSSRPVIRGFDGDRILVARDGIRDGSVSALSENEAEPLDLMSLDRIEVVRGPSTLLYGSNAIGGVVNAISRHDEDIAHGLHGYFTGNAGTNNRQTGTSGGAEYGRNNWGVWGTGTLFRASDYKPGGDSEELGNTYARVGNANGGAGYFGDKGFFTFNYNYYRNRYGIPVDPADPEERTVEIKSRQNDFRFNGGFRDLGSFFESVKFTFDYAKYKHRESETFNNDPEDVAFSEFHNKLYAYRGVVTQRKHGKLSGTFGYDGYHRNFFVIGDETLLPGQVNQTQNSGFVLEQVDLERVTFQFGGRVENSRYRPTDPGLINRTMTGVSGAAGMRVGLWENGAFVANYSHATRLPDLEELYDDGPHDDTLSFEMGNPNLRKEVSDGIDFSIRHQSKRLRADANFFFYNIKNFVFLQPTGEFDEDTGLEIANYVQGDSHFRGTEANLDFDADRHFTFLAGFDYVRAHFTNDVNLPRIPPMRGRLALDAHTHGFSVRPELILVADQDRLFTNETRTEGYHLFNILGSYVWLSKRFANTISINAFNLTDKFYRNHISFIKDFSPEIGRGVRASYTIRFF